MGLICARLRRGLFIASATVHVSCAQRFGLLGTLLQPVLSIAVVVSGRVIILVAGGVVVAS